LLSIHNQALSCIIIYHRFWPISVIARRSKRTLIPLREIFWRWNNCPLLLSPVLWTWIRYENQ